MHIDASTPVSTKIFVRRAASRQLTVGIWLVVLALEIFAANGEVLRRQPNATLKMPLTAPEPGFTSELAFNDLRFIQPVAIASPPGETNRLFIVEKWGHVCVITNLAAPTKTVFLDLWDRVPHDVSDSDYGLLSIAFHPGYATNGYFFVFYHLFATTAAGVGVHWRVARFQVSRDDPSFAPPESEVPLITQWHESAVHTGSDLHFGLDGYLYISVGDAEADYSTQRIDREFLSGILRIDVDKRRGSFPANPHPGMTENYRIPPDNPFIDATSFNGKPLDFEKVRTEFFAVGLRNPWRFAFDSKTGELYCNDTGGYLYEEINLILRGGNYGWYFYEGTTPLLPPASVERIYTIPPVGEYARDQGTCVSGALLYRGRQFPQLDGIYLFSDFYTGKIGSLRYPGLKLTAPLQQTLDEIRQQEWSLDASTPRLEASQLDWERAWTNQQANPTRWVVLDPDSFTAANGGSWKKLKDLSVLVTGANPDTNTYIIEASTALTGITAIRLETLTDDSLPVSGPGRQIGGAFILNEFRVTATDLREASDANPNRNDGANSTRTTVRSNLQPNTATPLILTNATADFSQTGYNVRSAIDGDLNTGWAISPEWSKPHQAVFETTEQTGFEDGTKLTFTLAQQFGQQATIGRLRLSVTTSALPVRVDAPPITIQQILRTPRSDRTAQQRADIAQYYRVNIAPELNATRERLDVLRQTKTALESRFPGTVEWIGNVRGISSFGINPANDDILMADYPNGTIRRLVFNTNTVSSLPLTLAETGVFRDLTGLTTEEGIVPYDVNVPFWSDNALKRRWFSLPDTNCFVGFNSTNSWSFPPGTVWIKHFELELTNGVPSSARRLETRLLVRGSNDVYGVTYRWDETGTNALLIPNAGSYEPILISDNGLIRTQVWRYPSRSECLQCHTPIAGFALGFNTAQLNLEHDYSGTRQNQIRALNDAGYFSTQVTNWNTLPALANATDTSVSLEYRVRSYLAANCVQCHQPGGSGRGYWDARFATSAGLPSLIDGMLLDNRGDYRNRVLKPGSLVHSILLQSLANLGPNHMPPVGTTVINQEAVNLIGQFVLDELINMQPFYSWQIDNFGDPVLPEAALDADPDGDGVPNYLEYLAFSDPNWAANGWSVRFEKIGTLTRITLPPIPARNTAVEWTTNLLSPVAWTPLVTQSDRTFLPEGRGEVQIEDPDASGRQKYYRLRIIPSANP